MTRLSLVRDFNLFPETETLLTLERKYGDSLNFEDLHGFPGKARKKKTVTADDIGSTGGGSAGTLTAFGGAKSGNITQQTAGSQEDFGTLDTRKDGETIHIMEEDIKLGRTKVDDKRKADTDAKN